MTETKTVCRKCESNGSSSDNYCSHCGEKDPWVEQPIFTFEEDDFPIVFSSSFSDDFYELRNDFFESYFGTKNVSIEDIHNWPDEFPDLKERHITVYWAITQSYSIVGPRFTREDALIAASNAEQNDSTIIGR